MSMRDEFEKAAGTVKSAYEEGFDDGMPVYRSDFDQRWRDSKAKDVYCSLLSSAAREQDAERLIQSALALAGGSYEQ